MDEKQLTSDLFDPRSFLCESNPAHGKFLTGSLLYRGETVSAGAVDQHLAALSDKRSSQFVEWIPNRLMSSICAVAPPYKTSTMSGTSLFNATSVAETLRRVLDQYRRMFKRRAFIH